MIHEPTIARVRQFVRDDYYRTMAEQWDDLAFLLDEYDAEHARRCDLERRFDTRLEGTLVADRAERWRDHVAQPTQEEWAQCREDITALLLWAQAVHAEWQAGLRAEVTT